MIKPNFGSCCGVLTVLFLCATGLSPGIWAQQPAPASPPPATQPQSPNNFGAPQSPPTADPAVPRDDRILWTLPNYLTVENASSLPPMTALQKFNLIAKDTFDPVTFAFIGLEAGLNQASNTNLTFGQGFKGYAKRYGLAFTDNAVGNFMTSAVFPIAFHQDSRFYQMGKGSFSPPCLVCRHEGFDYTLRLGNRSVQLLRDSWEWRCRRHIQRVPPRPSYTSEQYQYMGNTNCVGRRQLRNEGILAGHAPHVYAPPPLVVIPQTNSNRSADLFCRSVVFRPPRALSATLRNNSHTRQPDLWASIHRNFDGARGLGIEGKGSVEFPPVILHADLVVAVKTVEPYRALV